MPIEYLLDANILSDLVKRPRGPVATRISRVGAGQVSTSIIAAAEIRFGYHRKASAHLTIASEAVLDTIGILAFESPADIRYAELRTDLERKGQPIGANDLLIAAHALALGCTLVTDNEREFRRVPGLRVENWLR